MPKGMVSISSKVRESLMIGVLDIICPKVWNGFGVAWGELAIR